MDQQKGRQVRPCRVCAVPTCPKHDFRNLQPSDLLHKFPTNPEIRDQWAELVGLAGMQITSNMCVCFLHFEKERYHTKSCLQLQTYGVQSCTRHCNMVPKGVLPTKNLPSKIHALIIPTSADRCEIRCDKFKRVLYKICVIFQLAEPLSCQQSHHLKSTCYTCK
jgi:hypothetical protein